MRALTAATDALAAEFAAQGTPAVVQCHISHVYPAGASLYFTCIARCAEDPEAQWFAAKSAASAAILASRATITHHHAVGTDHNRLRHFPFSGQLRTIDQKAQYQQAKNSQKYD